MFALDAGSFRDPGGRVFTHGGRIYRAVFPANGSAYAEAQRPVFTGAWPSAIFCCRRTR